LNIGFRLFRLLIISRLAIATTAMNLLHQQHSLADLAVRADNKLVASGSGPADGLSAEQPDDHRGQQQQHSQRKAQSSDLTKPSIRRLPNRSAFSAAK
jgi:hypothetical protein